MSRCCSTPPSFVKRRTISLEHDAIVRDVTTEADTGVRIVRRPKREAPAPPPLPAQQLQPVLSTPLPPIKATACTVLVIDASQKMAHEITHELSRTLPGSTILFAPTLQIALWILKRRSIDLILTNSVLPDGPLTKLHEFLEQMSPPPELVVLSELLSSRSELGSHPGYRFVELRRLSARNAAEEQEPPRLTETISALGADLRNDLNNPLQEIVAMAFVAHSSQGLSPSAEQALTAIQRAATNMATVVNKLEDKIRGAVVG